MSLRTLWERRRATLATEQAADTDSFRGINLSYADNRLQPVSGLGALIADMSKKLSAMSGMPLMLLMSPKNLEATKKLIEIEKTALRPSRMIILDSVPLPVLSTDAKKRKRKKQRRSRR